MLQLLREGGPSAVTIDGVTAGSGIAKTTIHRRHSNRSALGRGGLAALVAHSDPEFTDLFRGALRPYVDMLVSRMREDIDAGLLRPYLDADGVVSLMLGAYLGELVRRARWSPVGWAARSTRRGC